MQPDQMRSAHCTPRYRRLSYYVFHCLAACHRHDFITPLAIGVRMQ